MWAGFEPTPTMSVDNFQIIVIKPLSSYRVRYQRTLDSQNLKISINIGDALDFENDFSDNIRGGKTPFLLLKSFILF